jgi:hypothetical protein
MADLPPLPEGWTAERALSLPPLVFARLPIDIRSQIQAYLDALIAAAAQELTENDHDDVEMDGDGEEREDMTEEEMARVAQERGFHISDLHGIFSNIAQQMVDENLVVWGFVVYKTWGYGGDAETWTLFWSKWQEFMDNLFKENGVTEDPRTGLAGKLQWHLVEDESFQGASTEQVREHFESLIETETLPEGLELDLCLLVDRSSVQSLLERTDDSVPFVIGVMSKRATEDAGTEGFFKIALEVLIPDVWFLLSEVSPGHLDPGGGVIYRGALTADADGGMGKRELIGIS